MQAYPAQKNTDIEALRALAIVAVIMAHVSRLLPADHPYLGLLAHAGFGFGVDIFFCVSGFIITQSLLPLIPAAPAPSLLLQVSRPFLVRRFWRLMPSALFWILALLLAAAVLDGKGTLLSFRESLTPALASALQVADFTFASCRDAGKCGEFGIYWSLSLENQFYLVLPLLAVCAGRRLLPLVFLGAFLAQFFIERQLATPTPFLWALRTDAICLGAFLALVSHTRVYRDLDPTVLRMPLLTLALVTYVLFLLARITIPHPPVAHAMGVTALLCALLTWIASYDRRYLTSNRVVRMLAVYIGSRSYAIYLTHMLAMSLAAWLAQHGPLAWLTRNLGPGVAVAVFLVLTLLFSELNYRVIEMPLREYGKRRTDLRIQSVNSQLLPWVKVIPRWIIPVIFFILVITLGLLHLPEYDFTVPTGWRLLSGQFVAAGLLGALLIAHLSIPPTRTDAAFHCTRRAIFMTSLAMLGAWYYALYPGVIIGADTSIMLSSVIGHDGYSAYSAFWNNFFGGLYALTGSLQVIPIFNMVLCAWTIANLLALTASADMDRYCLALVVFLLFILPVLPSSALLWSHDTTAGFLRLAIVSYAIWLCQTSRVSGMRARPAAALILSILIGACALTRSENLLLVVIVPWAMVYFRSFSWRMALACLTGSVLTIALFSGLIEHNLYRKEVKRDYSLSLLANPARYFYNNDFVSDTKADDLALLEEVFDRDWLRGTHFPYAPHHTKGLLIKPIDETTMSSLRATLFSIALHNPALVVQNRAIVAWTLISAAPKADYHNLNSNFDMDERVKAMYLNPTQVALYDALAASAQQRPERWAWVAQRIQTYFAPGREHSVLATFVWTLVPAFVCLLIALTGVRRRHPAAIASLILLPCIASVLLTAPASHFKYLTDIYVMGWFLPLLWYAERKRVSRIDKSRETVGVIR